ncbi:MAG: helix-turn-helix domain-containing protein, partial [Nitrososphaeria archaeon]
MCYCAFGIQVQAHPNEEQEKTLNNQLRMCRELYNRACKRLEYEKTGKDLSYA